MLRVFVWSAFLSELNLTCTSNTNTQIRTQFSFVFILLPILWNGFSSKHTLKCILKHVQKWILLVKCRGKSVFCVWTFGCLFKKFTDWYKNGTNGLMDEYMQNWHRQIDWSVHHTWWIKISLKNAIYQTLFETNSSSNKREYYSPCFKNNKWQTSSLYAPLSSPLSHP